MSIHVLSHVLRYSEARLGARLVLIALAEFAHDDGTKAFPSVETLMERSRLGRTGVKDALRKLREAGEIVETGETARGVKVYRVVMRGPESDRQWGPESDRGRNPTGGGPESDPDPSLTPKPSGGSGGSARASTPRIAGKPVNAEFWATTSAVLDEFNQQAGKHLGALTGAGEPSEAAKRIYGRVRAFPSLTVDDHAEIIRRTLASRWWGEGDPSVGVVYGPRVFEENLTRRVAPTTSAGTSGASATLTQMIEHLEARGQ